MDDGHYGYVYRWTLVVMTELTCGDDKCALQHHAVQETSPGVTPE